MGADVGADLDDDMIGLHQGIEHIDLALAELAVEVERSSDVHVERIDEHPAVTGLEQFHPRCTFWIVSRYSSASSLSTYS